MVNNMQLMYTAPTVHWTLPFSIALCLVEQVGLVVLVGHGPALEFDGDEALGNFLCTRRLKLQDIKE